MSTVNFAIVVDTQTSITDYDLGLISGICRWASDRNNDIPGYKLDILSDDSLGNPYTRIDLEDGGGFSTNSGWEFSLNNQDDIQDAFISYGIYFKGCPVELYTVIDGVFYLSWSGIIESDEITESTYRFICKDNSKSEFSVMFPNQVVSTQQFSNAPRNSIGKTIPVAVGCVPNAKLINVTGKGVEQQVGVKSFSFRGSNLTATVALSAGSQNGKYYLDLYSHQESPFLLSADQWGTGEYFLSGLKNYEGIIRIAGNDATVTSGFPYIRVFLCEPLSIVVSAYNALNRYYPLIPEQSDAMAFWEVIKLPSSYLISQNPIEEYTRKANGQVRLSIYDTEKNDFSDQSYLVEGLSTSGSDTIPFPFVKVKTNNLSKDGVFNFHVAIPPAAVQTVAYTDGSMSVSGLGSSTVVTQPSLIDLNRNTSVSCVVSNAHNISVSLLVYVPTSAIADGIDGLSLGLDYDVVCDNNFFCKFTSQGHYIIGGSTATDPISTFYYPLTHTISGTNSSATAGNTSAFNFLPNDYYYGSSPGNVDGESKYGEYHFPTVGGVYSIKEKLKINPAFMDSLKTAVTGDFFSVTLLLSATGAPCNISIIMKQVGFIASKDINIVNQDLFIRTKGEKFNGSFVEDLPSVLKHLMVTYGGINPSAIDLGNTSATRSSWPVGRQYLEPKPLFDYINELAKDGFISIYQGNDGRYYFRDWISDTSTSGFNHSESSILRDSVGELTNTHPNRIYSDFIFRYDFNPYTKEFGSSIVVTKANEATFPVSGAMVGSSNIPLWTTYVNGVDDYLDAYSLWSDAHNGYLRTGFIQKMPQELGDLYSFINRNTFDAGTGNSSNNSALKYAQVAVAYFSREKSKLRYSIPLTSANIQKELLISGNLSYAPYTLSLARQGWLTSKTLNIKKRTLDIEVSLNPV